MARRRLKQTKAAKAARRRYRNKKGGGARVGAGVKRRKGRRGGFLPAMLLGPFAKMLGM